MYKHHIVKQLLKEGFNLKNITVKTALRQSETNNLNQMILTSKFPIVSIESNYVLGQFGLI